MALVELELEVYPADLYPPLLGDVDSVTFSSNASPEQPLVFDFTVNGEAGEVPGISMVSGSVGGALSFTREFLQNYGGAWPAELEVHASRDGIRLKSATLRLHDTRTMKAAQAAAIFNPDPVSVLEGIEQTVKVSVVFLDSNGIELPRAEVSWEMDLPDAPQGVRVEGNFLFVGPDARIGPVAVRVSESGGLEQQFTLTLRPPRDDVAFEFYADAFYPPHLEPMRQFHFELHAPSEELFFMSYRLNGDMSPVDGISVSHGPGKGQVTFTHDFIRNYTGPWPAKLELLARQLDDDVVAAKSFELLDTRTATVDKLYLVYSPSDRISIPQDGETLVVAAPRFEDKNGVSIPFDELSWKVRLWHEVPGVTAISHTFLVSSHAKPGVLKPVLHELTSDERFTGAIYLVDE